MKKAILFCVFCFSVSIASAQIEAKQSTALDIIIGPLLLAADGITPATTINPTSLDVDLYKGIVKTDLTITLPGGGVNDSTHVANGYFSLELTSGNLDTLGVAKLTINSTPVLPLWHNLRVVSASAYEIKYGSSEIVTASEIWGASSSINDSTDTMGELLNLIDDLIELVQSR